jgi:hypothetical protein
VFELAAAGWRIPGDDPELPGAPVLAIPSPQAD